MSRTRTVLMASVVIALGSSSFAVAQNTGRAVIQGERNGTTTKETEIISRIDAGTGKKGGYSTRQSNLSSSGGGAIYGCRSSGGANSNPCLRANNLSAGKSFEFNATSGPVGGTITVGAGGDSKKPFTTNATGVADGLNADRVDGLNADQIIAAAQSGPGNSGGNRDQTRFALINEDGRIEQQTGGFSIVNCFQANDNCYIDAGEDVRNNAIHAQIVIQNVDAVDDATVLSGETGTAPCGAAFVNCAPENTERNEVIVVAPRRSDGTPPTGGNRLRFYVTVTGTEAR